MATGRSIPRLSAAAALLVASASGGAVSANPHRSHHAQPVPAARDTDTLTTAAIPAGPAAHPSDATAKAGADTLPPPFRLPAASHARVRDCGRKWQAMKMSGEAGDDIWRDFATRCLAAASGPFEKR